jgi:hypothetical protein
MLLLEKSETKTTAVTKFPDKQITGKRSPEKENMNTTYNLSI